jgi:hypothetical protein
VSVFASISPPIHANEVLRRLAGNLGLGAQRPDTMIRFGYGPEMPRSLRRPVEQVILTVMMPCFSPVSCDSTAMRPAPLSGPFLKL